jgi:hypothetical protein
LPERGAWDRIFLAAIDSPDPNGRQWNGMGGGISSLSKICVLAPSDCVDADIDHTFAQVQIREAAVDYRGNSPRPQGLRDRREAGAAERRYSRGVDPQHKHQQDRPLQLSAGR